MIIKVDNCHYSKLSTLELKSNTFTLYIQCFKKFNTNRDIYEFRTDGLIGDQAGASYTSSSKIYVSSSTVVKIFVPDFSSLDTTLESLIASAIDESTCSIVKYVFVTY